MKTVVFDIETDGLLEDVTQVYVISAQDYTTGEVFVFSEEDCGSSNVNGTLEDGVRFLKKYDRIVAHNLLAFDYHILEKFFPRIWSRKQVPFSKCWDTYIQSKAQLFDRPRIKGCKGNHGLEYYGLLFKYPKPPINDWTYWDAGKLNRVLVDVEINVRTLEYLDQEAIKFGIDFTQQIRRTQATSYWYTKQALYGTMGDVEHMKECVIELDILTEIIREEVEPLLPKQIKVKSPKATWTDIRDKWDVFFRKVPRNKFDEDGKVIKETYMPTIKFKLKNGQYDRHTSSHFGIPQDPFESCELIGGPYTKITFEDARMSQHKVIKDYLLSCGWIPTQFTYKKDKEGQFERDSRGQMIPNSPKLTEDSFDSIEGELGKKIAQYNTYMHRRRTFQNDRDDTKGWINQIRKDGRISAGCNAWQTSTSRGSQSGIVNCPSASSLYGANMRKSWIASEGNILISTDQDSSQLRALANFMGDYEYTQAVLSGTEFDESHNYVGSDPHTLNAIAFGVMEEDMVVEARETQDKTLIKTLTDIRKYAKNGIYAYLFGSGDAKLAVTLKLKTAAQGKAIKESFTSKFPSIGMLQERLKKQFKENKYGRGGFIESVSGTWVYCMSEHKLLNYLLMSTEAQVQQEAICWFNSEVDKRGLHGNQVLSFHDELTAEFPLYEKDQGIQLMSEMYGEASRRLGMEVLITGTAQSGTNWLEIH